MAIAQLTGLTYRYPGAAVPALDGVSLEVDGGVTLVTGSSGGGKSTLLRVFNGLVPHFHGGRISGAASVAGMDVISTPTARLARAAGFVFQDPELQVVYQSVEREVAFGLENAGVARATMRERVVKALHEAGIEHLAGRLVRTLSGGERQRVAIASALAMQPRLVVLDEPTSQLDAQGAALVMSAVDGIARSGRSVVIAEHRVEHMLGRASMVVEVERGRARTANARAWTAPVLEPPGRRAAAAGAEAWSLDGVTAGFAGHTILERVTLAGRQGEVLALSGPNGAGKTTLLRVIAGAVAPWSGRVARRPGRIAYLPQNPIALLHRPTVRAEVELTLERAREPRDGRAILDALGLTALAGRYPRDLSSGERQRAAIAAVLAGRPKLVLLDEPTRGMDLAARSALIRLIDDLRSSGASVVLATHDRALQAAVADRAVLVCGGRVAEQEALPA